VPSGSTSPTAESTAAAAGCGMPNRSASDQPAQVAALPSAARKITVGVKHAPAARKSSHHGKASLHWIS
jgi:hypothetical protein